MPNIHTDHVPAIVWNGQMDIQKDKTAVPEKPIKSRDNILIQNSMSSKLINTIHKLEGTAVNEIEHLMSWMQGKTPIAVNAFMVAHNVTQAFVNAAKSPAGQTAETLLAVAVPQTAAWAGIVLPVAQKLANVFEKIADDIPAVEGVALRYGAEIVSAIEGGKDTIDNYILEFQKMYLSVPAPAALAVAA